MRSHARRASGGFTLVEMLVVLSIIAILSSIIFLSLPGIKGARDMANDAYTIQGVLEQARTYAMANNTYVWVGFFEEDPTKAEGTAGTGQVVISVVASNDGTKVYSSVSPASFTGTAGGVSFTPATRLTAITKLIKIPSLHIDPTGITTANITTLPTPPTPQGGNSPELGATGFPVTGAPTFPFPLTGTATYNFTQILEISPQGDISPIDSTPTQLVQIGLRPARGNASITTSNDVVALQVTGIGGQVLTYKP